MSTEVQRLVATPDPDWRSHRSTFRPDARLNPTFTAGRLLPDFDTRAGGQLLSTQKVDKQRIDELR
jgi:hypothetical protein